jgi:hypothetical protein
MSDTAYQTLNALLAHAPHYDESDREQAAALLAQVRPTWWPDDFTARVAECAVAHLAAGQRFGLNTLRAEVPGEAEWERLTSAGEMESVRVGVQRVREEGERADLLAQLARARDLARTMSPAEVSAWLTGKLAGAVAGATGATRVSDLPSVIDYLRGMRERPNSVIGLHPEIDRHLRWGGLPVSDEDGDTVIICAPSSHGKTALALSITLSVAKRGHRVTYNVLNDASAYQIKERLVYAVAALPLKGAPPLEARLPPRGTRPAESLEERLAWAEGIVEALPIDINPAPDLDQNTLRVRLHHTRLQKTVLSVFDNLDHLRWDEKTGGRMDRRYQLGELTAIIRQFDRATGHHSLILAQSSRAYLDNDDLIPRKKDTADSDQPQRHCTLFLGLYNPNVDEEGARGLHLRGGVWKNRQGETGRFTLPANLVNPALGSIQ